MRRGSPSDGIFERIDMGMPAQQLVTLCGDPDLVDSVTMDGVQVGVGSERAVDGYLLSLWYYGRSVMYVINGRVWGRVHYESPPDASPRRAATVESRQLRRDPPRRVSARLPGQRTPAS